MQSKLSKLQKRILLIAFARGGRVTTQAVRLAIFGAQRNLRVEQTQASVIARSATRLVGRGLLRRPMPGLVILTPNGVLYATRFATEYQQSEKENENATV